MRTVLRSALGAVLALPLVAAAGPASAGSVFVYGDRGAFAEVYLDGPTTPGGLPGNYSQGSLSIHGEDLVEGWVDTFDCDPGEVPWGDENGQNACDLTGSFYAWSDDVSLVTGKGKAAPSTFSGTVDLFDATVPGEVLAADDVPYAFTFTPSGATSRSTYTDTYRDPENGLMYRYRESRVAAFATVTGDLDGLGAMFGAVGTYTLRSVEHIG